MSSLAIAVPTYRRPHLLARLLSDLTEQDLKPDVIIVVDGEADTAGVREVLARGWPFSTKLIHSTQANLPFQRRLAYQASAGCDLLLYLDDDLRIRDRTSVRVVVKALDGPGVVAATAAILAPASRRPQPWARGRGSSRRVWAGDLTPSGNRTAPPTDGNTYPKVGWLRGGVMAFRRPALSLDCFPESLMGMASVGLGLGEDLVIARRVLRRGRIVLAVDAKFEHPATDQTRSFVTTGFRGGFAAAYSRRLINDVYRGDRPTYLVDRLALGASWAGNAAHEAAEALRSLSLVQSARACGYVCGALEGAIRPPGQAHTGGMVGWDFEARRSLETIERVAAQ